MFRARGLTRLIAHEACGPLQQLGLVAAGLGIALSLDSIGNVPRRGVALLALDRDMPTSGFFLLWRRDDEREQVRTFIEVAREAASMPNERRW